MGPFEDKVVAVTGAGGSIGFEICRTAAEQGARELRLISLTEAGLYNANRKLASAGPNIVPILGSYGNQALMCRSLRGVDILIHAGAHKHVPICEANPLEAIANNVLATYELLRVARQLVGSVVVVSSDKAVRPTSIMGATKRVVEKLTIGNAHRVNANVVRFGNVKDSAGSVFPLWREQIAKGGPVTLTSELCQRFFMTIPAAVDLVSMAVQFGLDFGRSGDIYVGDMGDPYFMGELAKQMIMESERPDTEIKITGLRPGEKLVEELNFGGMERAGEKIFRVTDPTPSVDPEDFASLQIAYHQYNEKAAVELLWRLAL
jgi:FlaA1/EpsC-like NDP-sugar epimerase